MNFTHSGNKRSVVISEALDHVNRAADANATLKSVLGLDSTLPLWAESAFDAMMNEFLESEQNRQDLVELRNNLELSGLAATFPIALSRIGEHLQRRESGE